LIGSSLSSQHQIRDCHHLHFCFQLLWKCSFINYSASKVTSLRHLSTRSWNFKYAETVDKHDSAGMPSIRGPHSSPVHIPFHVTRLNSFQVTRLNPFQDSMILSVTESQHAASLLFVSRVQSTYMHTYSQKTQATSSEYASILSIIPDSK
jgi:hypothetical protein